jgi:hypothetical protein
MDTKQAALGYRGGFLSKLIIYPRGGISAVGRTRTWGRFRSVAAVGG